MDSIIWGVSGYMMLNGAGKGHTVVLWDPSKMKRLVGPPTYGGEWGPGEVTNRGEAYQFHKHRKMIGAVSAEHAEAFQAWVDKRLSKEPLPFPLGEMNRKPWTRLGG